MSAAQFLQRLGDSSQLFIAPCDAGGLEAVKCRLREDLLQVDSRSVGRLVSSRLLGVVESGIGSLEQPLGANRVVRGGSDTDAQRHIESYTGSTQAERVIPRAFQKPVRALPSFVSISSRKQQNELVSAVADGQSILPADFCE